MSRETTYTSLPNYAFFYLFYDCDITTVPTMPSSVVRIGNGCFEGTFMKCTQLTEGVDLRNVTVIGNTAILRMYKMDTNLTVAYTPSVDEWDASKSNEWLYEVSGNGIVYKPSTLTIPPTIRGSGVPDGWTTEDYPA